MGNGGCQLYFILSINPPNIYNVQLLHVKGFASQWRYNHNYDIVLALKLAPILVRETENKQVTSISVFCALKGPGKESVRIYRPDSCTQLGGKWASPNCNASRQCWCAVSAKP